MHSRPWRDNVGLLARVAALAVLLGAPCGAWAAQPYVLPAPIDLPTLLPPAPADDSPQTHTEAAELVQLQHNVGAARIAQARNDAAETVFRFADFLGPNFTAANLPNVALFFARLAADESMVISPAKSFWHRIRPYARDPAVQKLVPVAYSGSYPSGHATFASLCAIVLADMLPEQRAALFARAADYRLSRMIGGMHYRSDVMAGQIAGTLIAQDLRANPEFLHDEAAAEQELRAALKLPALR